jgi:NAD(P)-dependent dehydrogenase (short-subunit alcohol dehydrogenase family)
MSVQQGPLDLAHLSDTVCCVTGAGNGGIGYGILEIAAELGLHCAVLDLHLNICTQAAARLSAAYPAVACVGIECDVTSPESLASAHAAVLHAFPGKRIGAVFANAGVSFPAQGVLGSSIDNWKLTFGVNVIGVVNTIKEFVPAMQADPGRGAAVLCTTASIGGLIKGPPNLADYCASKSAVVALTEALSLELSASDPHIRVCVCCPCIVGTGLFLSSHTNKHAEPGADVEAALPGQTLTAMGPIEPFAMTPKNHGRQVLRCPLTTRRATPTPSQQL